jgi:type I restriction enzyme S subunit
MVDEQLSTLMVKRASLNPAKYPDEKFELYSIPAYDAGKPEVVKGLAIGSSKKCVEENDVLLSRIVPHIRRAWVVGKYDTFRKIGSGEWIIFKNKNVDSYYLRYFFLSDIFHPQLMQTVSGVGGSLLRARPEQIKKIKIPLPPLDTQKRIVALLDQAQALIDKRKQQLALMDQLASSLFYEMFGDPVRNTMGWEVKNVEDICDSIMGGGTPSKNKKEYYNGIIPWVTPKDMKTLFINGSIDKITEEAIKNSSTKLVPIGSVLMVIRSGILKKKLPVAINMVKVTLNQDMKAFIPKNDAVSNLYLLYFFYAVQKFLLKKVRAFTADNIEFKQIKELRIPLPPFDLQTTFAARIEKIEQQKAAMQTSLGHLQENFNALMQRAFRGEI